MTRHSNEKLNTRVGLRISDSTRDWLESNKQEQQTISDKIREILTEYIEKNRKE